MKSQKYADITTGVVFIPFFDRDIGNNNNNNNNNSNSRSDEIAEVRRHHNWHHFHPFFRSRHREPGASRPFTSSWRSAADWQLWPTNHSQQRFFVSVFLWRFSATTPSAWRGHFGAQTQRSLRWTIEQGLLLLVVVYYFVISLCFVDNK